MFRGRNFRIPQKASVHVEQCFSNLFVCRSLSDLKEQVLRTTSGGWVTFNSYILHEAASKYTACWTVCLVPPIHDWIIGRRVQWNFVGWGGWRTAGNHVKQKTKGNFRSWDYHNNISNQAKEKINGTFRSRGNHSDRRNHCNHRETDKLNV